LIGYKIIRVYLFKTTFPVYPWLTHLLTGPGITLNLKRWLIKIVPIDVHSKINSQPFIQSERGFQLFSLTWDKSPWKLNSIKIKYLFIFFNPYLSFRFILLCTVFYSLWKNSLPISLFLLVFLYFWGVYFPLNFLFFIVHGIQRFSNRCLEIPLLGLGFSWSLGLSSLFSPSLFILVLIIALVVLLILSFFFYLCLSCPDLFCLCPFILILLSSLADFLSVFFCQCVIIPCFSSEGLLRRASL
jgi:hypothetical protein